MKHLIGIDPDVDKSGFATWDGKQLLSVSAMSLAEILTELTTEKENIIAVHVEAGWLNKSNWHLHGAMTKQKAAQIGNSAGRNHQRGIDIVEICEWLGIPCRLIQPTTKNSWKNNADLFKKMTGWKGRTNPESRDAAMLVYGTKLQGNAKKAA